MPAIIDPKTVGLLDDAARIAATKSRTSLGVNPIKGRSSTGKALSSKDTATDKTVDQATAVAAGNALRQMDKDIAPTMTDAVLEKSSSALNIIGFVPFIGPMVLKFASGAVGTVGGWVGSERMQKWDAGVKKAIGHAEEATISSVAKKMGIHEPVSKAANGVAERMSGGVARVSSATGLGKRFSNFAFGSAQGKFTKLAKHNDALSLSVLSQVHSDLIPEVAELKTMVSKAENVGHLDHAAFVKSVTTLESKMAEMKTASKEIASGPAAKHLERFVNSASHTAEKLGASKGWLNPADAVKAIPGKLGKATVAHTVMNGAFIAGSGLSIATDARKFRTQVRLLKEMIYDLTGEHVSTSRALFGSVPESAKAARSVIIKKQVAKFGADTAGLLTNIKMALSNKFGLLPSMAAFMIPEGISQVVDASMSDTLEAYGAFKHNALTKQAAGTKLDASDYIPFIMQLEPHIKAKGTKGEAFAQKAAEYYASIQASPAEVLREIQNGSLLVHVHTAINKNDALTHANHQPQVSHVERLANGGKKALNVVGEHTNNVISSAANATLVRS